MKEKAKEKVLSNYFMIYTQILDFDYPLRDLYAAPEDPHVILRGEGKYQEPAIIFNLNDGRNRRLYSIFRHRSTLLS